MQRFRFYANYSRLYLWHRPHVMCTIRGCVCVWELEKGGQHLMGNVEWKIQGNVKRIRTISFPHCVQMAGIYLAGTGKAYTMKARTMRNLIIEMNSLAATSAENIYADYGLFRANFVNSISSTVIDGHCILQFVRPYPIQYRHIKQIYKYECRRGCVSVRISIAMHLRFDIASSIQARCRWILIGILLSFPVWFLPFIIPKLTPARRTRDDCYSPGNKFDNSVNGTHRIFTSRSATAKFAINWLVSVRICGDLLTTIKTAMFPTIPITQIRQ